MRWTSDRILRWTLATLFLAAATWGLTEVMARGEGEATNEELGLPNLQLLEPVARPTIDVRPVGGEGGARPSLILEIRNVSDDPVHHLELWARIGVPGRWSTVTPVVLAVDPVGSRLFPGDTRRVTLRPNLARATTDSLDATLTADVYWTFGTISPSERGTQAPRMRGLKVAGR